MYEEIITYFITVTAITGGITFLAKQLFKMSTKTVLENYKNELKKDFEEEKNKLKQQYDKYDRQRVELKKWTNPILASINGLAGRLNHIDTQKGYKSLGSRHPQYEYYYPSTLYYFTQYLCWIQILKEEINYEIFSEKEKEQAFFTAIRNMNLILRNTNSPAPIFSLQQRHIAEIMMVESNGRRTCMSYNDFTNKLQDDKKFKDILKPLIDLVETMKGPDKYTAKILEAAVKLQNQCQSILRS